jgi:DUF971 family protein
MGGHLASARLRVGSGAHRLKHHGFDRHSQRETQRPVAIIEVEPVVSRPEELPRRGQHRFVPGT